MGGAAPGETPGHLYTGVDRQDPGWSPRLIAQPRGIGRMTVGRDSPGADLSRAPRSACDAEEPSQPVYSGDPHAMACRVAGGAAALSSHPTPGLPGELPHRGALCPASAPSTGAETTGAAPGPPPPAGSGWAAPAADHPPCDPTGAETVPQTDRRRHAVDRAPQRPAC